MNLRTPLGRVRGHGSAKEGTHHWWLQRMSAIALVPLSIAFVVLLIKVTGAEHADAVATLGHPFGAGVTILFIFAALYHFRLGLQVVIEDYVHGSAAKITLLLANTFGCVALGLACVMAVLKLAFGG